MTQNELPQIPFTLVAPVTVEQIEKAPLNTTQILAADGRTLVPLGRLNWALHNTYEGDVAYFAERMNAEAADGTTNR